MFWSCGAAIAGRKKEWEGVRDKDVLLHQDQCFRGQAYVSEVCYNARSCSFSQDSDSLDSIIINTPSGSTERRVVLARKDVCVWKSDVLLRIYCDFSMLEVYMFNGRV